MKGESSAPRRVYRRKPPEKLDWRKIASIDIDRLGEDSESEACDDLCSQILNCVAESEFDSTRVDPGFVKVFKVCQILIERLLISKETLMESSGEVETLRRKFEDEKKALAQEISGLKESLTKAKRELKKRMEVIAQNQNEMLDGNRDEFDQCPYCTKRFLASFYLYSHIQRRHQGLPIPLQILQNVFPIQLPLGINPTLQTPSLVGSEGQVNHTPRVAAVNTETQTDLALVEGATNRNGIDVQIVEELLDKFLQEKGLGGSGGSSLQSSTIALAENPPQGEVKGPSVEEVEVKFSKMRNDLEEQWRGLVEKMHQSGFDELKNVLLDEMNKMHEVIKSNAKKEEEERNEAEVREQNRKDSPGMLVSPGSPGSGTPTPSGASSRSESPVERQIEDFEAKAKEDIETKRLEAQERFWRSKMKAAEQEYLREIEKLRQEIRSSMSENALKSEGQVRSPPRSPRPPNTSDVAQELPLMASTPRDPLIQPAPIQPTAKPRRFGSQKLDQNHQSPQGQPIPTSSSFHTLNPQQLKANETSDYSDSEDSHESDEIETESSFYNSGGGDQGQGQMDRMEMVRSRVVSELNKQMIEMGLNPDGTEVDHKDKVKAQKILQESRGGLPEFLDHRESYREGLKDVLKQYKYEADQEKADSQNPIKLPSGKNRFSKMFSAVKTRGKNFHKKVALTVKKRNSGPSASTLAIVGSPKSASKSKSKIGSLFSRKWIGGSKGESGKGGGAELKATLEREKEGILPEDESETEVSEGETEISVEEPLGFREPPKQKTPIAPRVKSGQTRRRTRGIYNRNNQQPRNPGETDSDLSSSRSPLKFSRGSPNRRPISGQRPHSARPKSARPYPVAVTGDSNLLDTEGNEEEMEPLIVVRPKKSAEKPIRKESPQLRDLQVNKRNGDGFRVEMASGDTGSDGSGSDESIESLYIPEEQPKRKNSKEEVSTSLFRRVDDDEDSAISPQVARRSVFIPKNSWDDDELGGNTDEDDELMYKMGIKARPTEKVNPMVKMLAEEAAAAANRKSMTLGLQRSKPSLGVFATTTPTREKSYLKPSDLPVSSGKPPLEKKRSPMNNSWDSISD